MVNTSRKEQFIPSAYSAQPDEMRIAWLAPSNIALVKYWGKKEIQIPANASLSFTLSNCVTETEITFNRKTSGDSVITFDFLFHGEKKEGFLPKLQTFFDRCLPYLPYLPEYHMTIESENSFPHSSGIASSASAMAAMALCLVDMERCLSPEADTDFKRKASFIARLGSGSACRSIEGPLVHWGSHPHFSESSDLYGTAFLGEINPVFQTYRDAILIVEAGVKSVSSTVGHGLMKGHPFSAQRFEQAHKNMGNLKSILASGDLNAFTSIVELEALSLHSMMMTSTPSYLLMKPNTLEIINRVRAFREDSGIQVCFTLDAGANVHLLYPGNEEEKVLQFIKDELIAYCQDGVYICDKVGSGASKQR